MNFPLGTELKDAVTGFKGIATSRIEYINGCVQYGLAGPLKDGLPSDAQFFDFQRLEPTGLVMTMPSREGGSDAQSRPSGAYKG